MQIWKRKIKCKKSTENWFWERVGLHLGGVWDSLVPLLGSLVRFWAVFWAFEIKLREWNDPRWAPRGLLDRFWVHLGRVLGGSWEDLGQSLDGF